MNPRLASKAKERGAEARREGRPMESNPLRHGPNVVLVAYWDAGWTQEDERIRHAKAVPTGNS